MAMAKQQQVAKQEKRIPLTSCLPLVHYAATPLTIQQQKKVIPAANWKARGEQGQQKLKKRQPEVRNF